MKICFDLRALQIGHENRGIGMHIINLLENIDDSDDEFIFYIYDSSNPIKKLGIDVAFDYTVIKTPFMSRVVRKPLDLINAYKVSHHHFRELSHNKPDIFVQFDFNLGLPRWRDTKTVVIGYDLIPLVMKNQYIPSNLFAWRNSSGIEQKMRAVARAQYYRHKYSAAYKVYKNANHIICISNYVAKSFRDLLGVDKNKISTIPLAPAISKKTTSVEKPVGMPDKPYLFYIGGTDTRKQIGHLIKAFNIVRGRGLDVALVLAGNEFKTVELMPDIIGRDEILKSAYRKDIHTLGFVSEKEKKYLYRNAYAFVFTSSYEGFGLPVVEAMAEGSPVVTYKNSAIPEAGGEVALYARNGDYASLANKILELQNMDRERIVKKGKQQAAKFSWSDTASKTLEILSSTL